MYLYLKSFYYIIISLTISSFNLSLFDISSRNAIYYDSASELEYNMITAFYIFGKLEFLKNSKEKACFVFGVSLLDYFKIVYSAWV